jgi:hypothetical protein
MSVPACTACLPQRDVDLGLGNAYDNSKIQLLPHGMLWQAVKTKGGEWCVCYDGRCGLVSWY